MRNSHPLSRAGLFCMMVLTGLFLMALEARSDANGDIFTSPELLTDGR